MPAVADDRRGVRQHRVLRDPLLDVDVGRQRAQLRGIAAVADRQQHPHGQRRERVDRRAVERRVVGEVLARGHRPERHVDEGSSSLPGHQSGSGGASAGTAGAEAMGGPRRRDGGVLERLREHRQERRLAHPVAGRVGRQAELGARRVDRGRGQVDRERLDRGEPERDPDDRDPVELGDQRGGVLPALADDHVGPPVLDDGAQAGQRRGGVHAGEVLADHHGVGGVEVQLAELGEQRHPLLRRRLAEGRVRQAGPLDVACVLAPAPRPAPRARRAARRARTAPGASRARHCPAS